MTYSIVARILKIEDHPAAHSLDIVSLSIPSTHGRVPLKVVTGKHYREGDLGLFIGAGACIPGWLAEEGDFGKEWFDIRVIEKKGIESPGVFYGSVWRTKKGKPYLKWQWWRDEWKEGDVLDDWLGIVPGW